MTGPGREVVLFYLGPLIGLVTASVTAEQEVLGSIPGSDKVLLGFSIRNFLEAVSESGFVPGGLQYTIT